MLSFLFLEPQNWLNLRILKCNFRNMSFLIQYNFGYLYENSCGPFTLNASTSKTTFKSHFLNTAFVQPIKQPYFSSLSQECSTFTNYRLIIDLPFHLSHTHIYNINVIFGKGHLGSCLKNLLCDKKLKYLQNVQYSVTV